MYDVITGLFSREQFFRILEKQVKSANEYKVSTALLVIEIQRFRAINVNYGYSAGDEVLKSFAELLGKIQRQGDYAARIGNDCFALLLTRVVNPGHAKLAAFKIQQLLEIPLEIGGSEIRYNAVIGIALCPLHTSRPEGLLTIAEEALEYAKRKQQKLGFLDHDKKSEISEHWDIEYELRGAIDRSEFAVFFQPKLSILNRRPVPMGAEALVRWNSRSRGLVPPGVFLQVAENMGLMKPLTIWMLNSALRLSQRWPEKWGNLVVSVNIPPDIVSQADFVDIVLSTTNLWKSERITLCVEILEQSMVQDPNETFDKLKELREHGIKISIDDFGTGYSSLSYFRDIPADELKIDKSFVFNLLQNESNLNIVGLIIDLARRFGLSVVAEGVENRETLEKLIALKCDQVQGYFFSRPIPSDEFLVWLSKFQG
jgi:diguanylate cyclase (GGDEF)-like protein